MTQAMAKKFTKKKYSIIRSEKYNMKTRILSLDNLRRDATDQIHQ